jgi:hypothetical protein
MRVISRLLLLPKRLLSLLLLLVACGVTQEDACVYRGTIQDNPKECTSHLDCFDKSIKSDMMGRNPICNFTTNKCESCKASSYCQELTNDFRKNKRKERIEFCVPQENDNPQSGQCVPCSAKDQSQCSSGLCRTADPLWEQLLPKQEDLEAPVLQIGECFPETNILHVDNQKCTQATPETRGSRSNPFCDLTTAQSAARERMLPYVILAVERASNDPTPYSSLNVPSGTVVLRSWPPSPKPGPSAEENDKVQLMGLNVGGAGVTAKALAVGIQIRVPPGMDAVTCQESGVVWLRDAKVTSQKSGSAADLGKAGVIAKAGCTDLRIERTHVDFFAENGLRIEGGKYHIVNSAITRCGQGNVGNMAPELAGVYLGQGEARLGTIMFSTIAVSLMGLYCEKIGNEQSLLENTLLYSILSNERYQAYGYWDMAPVGNNIADPTLFSQLIPNLTLPKLILDPSQPKHLNDCIDKVPADAAKLEDSPIEYDYFGTARIKNQKADYGFYESPPVR